MPIRVTFQNAAENRVDVTRKTDGPGRTWEHAERVKERGKWQPWTWDGFLGRKPKILCTAIR